MPWIMVQFVLHVTCHWHSYICFIVLNLMYSSVSSDKMDSHYAWVFWYVLMYPQVSTICIHQMEYTKVTIDLLLCWSWSIMSILSKYCWHRYDLICVCDIFGSAINEYGFKSFFNRKCMHQKAEHWLLQCIYLNENFSACVIEIRSCILMSLNWTAILHPCIYHMTESNFLRTHPRPADTCLDNLVNNQQVLRSKE